MAQTKTTTIFTSTDKELEKTTQLNGTHYTNGKQRFQKDREKKNSDKRNSGLQYLVVAILCSILIGFSDVRNYIIWNAQEFWKTSGIFCQSKWENILSVTGEDPFVLWFVCSLILTITAYWTVGAIYTILDVTNKPAFIRKYKVQPGTNEPVDRKRLLEVISQVLFNQIIVGVPFSYMSYVLMGANGYPPHKVLPSFHRALLELAILIIIEEFGFYYSHRLLHNRHVYKYIHKKHHEWTAPIAITAIYCHPIEHIFSNLLPPLLGVYFVSTHVVVAWFWFCLAHLNTLNAHSGYHLPFFPSPEAHDFHHLKFNQCFGVLGVLDWLHGTDSLFRSSKAFARHIMMLSFLPANKAFPDNIE